MREPSAERDLSTTRPADRRSRPTATPLDVTPRLQRDEWLVGRRYLSAGSMEPLLEERLHRHNTQEEVPELQSA